MPVKPNHDADIEDSGRLGYREYRVLPKKAVILREAQAIEALLKRLLLHSESVLQWELQLDRYPKLKQLNSFGKQIVIRMLRSSYRFQGFKIEFDNHILKPHILFLLGTLSDEFDYMHTSPLNGVKALDIGCGALSEYSAAPLETTTDLITQFYLDRPPILAELLQMLGAQSVGVDPRENCADTYEYQVSYRHHISDFPGIASWLGKLKYKFDLMSCFNLYARQGFAYYYQTPEELTQFFKGLRHGLSPQGLLFTTAPLPPSSLENQQSNRQIFSQAGFQVLYEGYYMILEPRPKRSPRAPMH